MQQLKFSLPDDLRSQLDSAVAKSGRSLGNEIRERLAQSFNTEAIDEPTRELITGIARLAGLVNLDDGVAWHMHPKTHAVFVQMILKLVAQAEPKKWSEAVRDLSTGAGLTKKTDTAANMAEQLFRTYLVMQLADPMTQARRLQAKHLRKKGDDDGKKA
jgi:plasmid stability protein